MTSSNNGKYSNNKFPHSNQSRRSRYKARAIKARRNSFNRPSNSKSVNSIGETSLTLNQNRPSQKSSNPVNVFLNNVFRLTLVGVGIGTIFGSILANLDLTKPLFPKLNLPFSFPINNSSQNSLEVNQDNNSPTEKTVNTSDSTKNNSPIISSSPTIEFTQELTTLKNKLISLQKEKYPHLQPSVFLLDVDNGAYVDFNSITAIPAASTIKIPILVAFFQDVDQGKVFLDEKLKVSESSIGGGSGGMQYKTVGTAYSAIDTVTEMIINSDNTATNMIIERLGGKDKLNQRFQEWGLSATVINNSLPDLDGTNTTTARDLAMILAKVNQGQLVSLRSRDRLLDIMEDTRTKTLLPEGLEAGAIIAHKTGDIKKVLGDAGIIDITTGKRYIAAILVKRPDNDYTARNFIQEMSNLAYQHFKWYLPHPPLNNKK